ncbi:MAG: cytochrome C oxidase subunit IV family protein [Sandaracinaceae bacterium]
MEDGNVHVHVHPTKFYAAILGALLSLTVLTVAASYVDIDLLFSLGRPLTGVGPWNLSIAIGIAAVKASLVVLFFMHLKEDARFNALVFVGSLLFIGIFFTYTMNDTLTRGETGDPFNGVHVDPQTGERAPGGIAGPIPGEVLEEGLAAPDSPAEVEARDLAAEEASPEEPDLVDQVLGEEAVEPEVVADDGAEDDFMDAILGEEGAEPEPGDEAGEPEAGEPEAGEPEAAEPEAGDGEPVE